MFKTIAEIKRANIANGGKFFDRSHSKTSRTLRAVYHGRYFITAHKREFTGTGPVTDFNVWEVKDSGDVRKAATDSFRSLEAAREWAKTRGTELKRLNGYGIKCAPDTDFLARKQKIRNLYTALRSVSDDNDIKTVVADVLADIRHLCDWFGMDYAEPDSMAHKHYVDEPKCFGN